MLTDDSLGATSLTLFGIKPVFFFFFLMKRIKPIFEDYLII